MPSNMILYALLIEIELLPRFLNVVEDHSAFAQALEEGGGLRDRVLPGLYVEKMCFKDAELAIRRIVFRDYCVHAMCEKSLTALVANIRRQTLVNFDNNAVAGLRDDGRFIS